MSSTFGWESYYMTGVAISLHVSFSAAGGHSSDDGQESACGEAGIQ